MAGRLHAGAALRTGLAYLAMSAAVFVVVLPFAAERAVERVRVDEQLGTLPVRASLAHDGRSTLATGILGDIYYDATGAFGFGLRARVTGPPEAGRTLASYADPRFIRANLDFVADPQAVVDAYGREFGDRILRQTLLWSAVAGLAGGAVALPLWRRRSGDRPVTGRRVALAAAAVAVGLVASTGISVVLFQRWGEDAEAGYPLPGFPGLSFSSPQTLELARQIRPFIEKNRERIQERSAEFEAAAEASFTAALGQRRGRIAPRAGEVLVVAEADPQGGYVGTAVRTALLGRLLAELGEDAVGFRTISGDITSNGTVAEGDFVEREAAVGGPLTTVAVSGDHDSQTTQRQMRASGMVVPDLGTEEVAGLRVSGANDVEHKAMFGALVDNDSGLTQTELGAELRTRVSADEAGIVLVHQPGAAAGYLGVDMAQVRALAGGSPTAPYDDGIDDVPPGTVSIGHLHDLDGPWVLWNTGGDKVTWTVVDQLGTSGGMEERPTFNQFSTPISPPLKTLSFRLQHFDTGSGLQTGFATVTCDPDGECAISDRTDVGLPVSDPRVTGGS